VPFWGGTPSPASAVMARRSVLLRRPGWTPTIPRLSDTLKFRRKVMSKRLTDGCHPERISKSIAIDDEVSFDRRNLLGGSGAGNKCRSEPNSGARKSAFTDLYDAIWVGEDQFGPTRTSHAPETTLPVEQTAIGSVLRRLAVGEEWLTHVREVDSFLVVESVDRRILAMADSTPGPQEGRKGFHVGVQSDGHIPSMSL
jgi:hypothetical protein